MPGAVLAGLPGAAVVIFVHGVFRPPVDAENLPAIWAQVSLVGWLVGAVEFSSWRRPAAAEAPANARSVFHKRLPPELGDEIISISMQDHYAEVTTTLGAHLLLIRLTDAINELNGAAGLQLHRSHYAMKAHLVRLQREGGRLKVILSDGRALPVSARHAEEVRAALQESRPEMVITSPLLRRGRRLPGLAMPAICLKPGESAL